MPIPMTCQCGKALKIPDSMAGKAVKCPGCQTVLRVPSRSSAVASPSQPTATPQPARPQPAAPRVAGSLGDLFDEEGFDKQVGRICPNCSANLVENAVLCTACGFHAEHGEVLKAHETVGLNIDHGTLALRKAAKDMHKAKVMQDKLERGPGMPWWAHALILFMIVLGITVGGIAVNLSRQVGEENTFSALGLFLQLSGAAFLVVSFGAHVMIAAHAFKNAWWKGLLSLLVGLFTLYYVFTNFKATWKFLLISIVTGAIGGGMFMAGVAAMSAQ